MESNIINSLEQLKELIVRWESYITGNDENLRQKTKKLVTQGHNFVAYKIDDKWHFAPSVFIGSKYYYYKIDSNSEIDSNNKIDSLKNEGWNRNNRISELLKKPSLPDPDLDLKHGDYCAELGLSPTKHKKRFWRLDDEIILEAPSESYPGEVSPGDISKIHKEGAVTQILVNRYERNKDARDACKAKQGVTCVVCGFNFEERYGKEIGQDFIHVHHLKELSEIGEEYEVNPDEDLRPVCPNCHSMLHKKKPAYTIEELKQMMK